MEAKQKDYALTKDQKQVLAIVAGNASVTTLGCNAYVMACKVLLKKGLIKFEKSGEIVLTSAGATICTYGYDALTSAAKQ